MSEGEGLRRKDKWGLRVELKVGLIALFLIVALGLSRDISLMGSLKRGLVGFVILLIWMIIMRVVLNWLRKSK